MIPQGWGYYLKSATITVATSTNYASTTVGYLYSDKYSNVDLGSNGGNGVIFTFKNSDYIGKRLTPNTKYYYKVNAFISGIPYPDVERSNFVFTTGDFITFQNSSYSYDTLSRIKSILKDDDKKFENTIYTYDELSRLKQVEKGNVRNSTSTIIAESYAYSPTGKILTNGGVNYLYGTNLSHAPIGVASNTMSYDKRGRLSTSSEYGSFTFNSLDRLSEIKRGATTSKYYYDSEGNRLLSLTFSSTTLSSSTLKSRLFTPSSWVQDTGSTTSYAINLGSKPILSIERSIIPPVAALTPPRLPPRTPPRISPRIPANVLTKTQLILDQEGTLSKDISTAINTIASATTTPTHTTSIHILITDHLNSIESILDFKLGNTISSTTYNSFGSQSKSLDSNSNRSYTNHQYDKENNLLYMNARYQIPKQGQFISSDEATANVGNDNALKQITSNNTQSYLHNPQNLNSYSYVLNNPVHYVDPDGNMAQAVLLTFGIGHNLAISDEDRVAARDMLNDTNSSNWQRLGANYILYGSEMSDMPVSVGGVTKWAENKLVKNLSTDVARAGKSFTKKGKVEVIEANKAKNEGVTICANCKVETIKAQKSQKGITPPKSETNIDHIFPKSKGGSGGPSNGQVLCRECNIKKSNN